MKKETYYFKGDIIVKDNDAFMRWAVTSGQLCYVISTISIDGYFLVHRPFKNYFKAFIYWCI